MNRTDVLQTYFHLTREVLPARARREGWVVTADHCFQRIILDNVVGDAWRNQLTSKGPAYRQLSDEQLERAIHLATQIEREGDSFLRELNRNSLHWRGKVRG
ncbi:hypothetical protein [Spirosoma arcticum]